MHLQNESIGDLAHPKVASFIRGITRLRNASLSGALASWAFESQIVSITFDHAPKYGTSSGVRKPASSRSAYLLQSN
jgi:hypothetical protein